MQPSCFVSPRNTNEVAHVIKTLTSLYAKFTVKGGGHTAFAGASSIEGGVTIDLVKLKAITVSDDRQTVSVGAGTRWIEVSEFLDPQGLAVVGGRAADVGVSGLILGGGISYFSGEYGWACDNVRNYEIVLSSGEIVNASAMENMDLYWALRGSGGSNWGIVTRFDLAAFQQGDMWRTTHIYPGDLNRTLIPVFIDFVVNGMPKDHQAHTYFIVSNQPQLGGNIVLQDLFHATPPPVNTTPAVFEPFNIIPATILNSTVVTNISAHSRSIDEPYGRRQTWWDTSVAATSSELLQNIVHHYESYSSSLAKASGGTGFESFLVFQPISINVLEAMQKNGGNALGLKPSDGPLMLVQLATTWDNEGLDDAVETGSECFIDDVEDMAKEIGLLRGFVYMNYAGKSQDVLARYGAENLAKLRNIAAKWDPEGLLQQLWKGYFQLDGKM